MFLYILLVLPLLLSSRAYAADANETVAIKELVTQVTLNNINETLLGHQVVFLNFYADWCRFSALLEPLFASAAAQLAKEFPQKVKLGRVDCVREVELASRYKIKKFPTLKLFHQGAPLRKEYRGQRTTPALVAFVRKQLKSAIKRFNNMEQLNGIDPKRRAIIGFFESPRDSSLPVYRQLAERFKNDCDFYLNLQAEPDQVKGTNKLPAIVFRPDMERRHGNEELYPGAIHDKQRLEDWLLQNCVPLVREVDFDNVEELIEEGLPLLLLFHHSSDISTVKDFKSIVEMQLMELRGQFSFVTVDGIKFEHSVRHMNKTANDLPLIAIDSLKYMHPFSHYRDMYVPGKLKQFLQDFSKLNLGNKPHGNFGHRPTIPMHLVNAPKSTFQKLGPSRHRYTLLNHDEL